LNTAGGLCSNIKRVIELSGGGHEVVDLTDAHASMIASAALHIGKNKVVGEGFKVDRCASEVWDGIEHIRG
jgi:hypothetical protein